MPLLKTFHCSKYHPSVKRIAKDIETVDDLLSSNYDWGTVDGTIADALLGSSSDPAVKVSEQFLPTRSSSVPHEGVFGGSVISILF